MSLDKSEPTVFPACVVLLLRRYIMLLVTRLSVPYNMLIIFIVFVVLVVMAAGLACFLE